MLGAHGPFTGAIAGTEAGAGAVTRPGTAVTHAVMGTVAVLTAPVTKVSFTAVITRTIAGSFSGPQVVVIPTVRNTVTVCVRRQIVQPVTVFIHECARPRTVTTASDPPVVGLSLKLTAQTQSGQDHGDR